MRVGVLLGTRRVNQKPVLQVFDLDGRLLGYAKVGHNELTAALVRREAAALASIGAQAPQWFRVPRLIDHGQWGGLDILVTSPLVARGGAGDVSRVARVNAMLEVAALTARSTATLRGERLLDRPAGRRRPVVDRAVRRPSRRPGRDGRAALRRAPGAPRGLARRLEPLEHEHRRRRRCRSGTGSATTPRCRGASTPSTSRPRRSGRAEVTCGRQEEDFLRLGRRRACARWVSVPLSTTGRCRLYLVTVAARYVDALTHSATPALQRRTDWVLSLLERRCDEPRGGTRGEPT